MGYQIYKFETAMLPVANNEQEHSPGETQSAMLDSVGGAFDYWGDVQRHPRRSNVTLSGVYIGERSFEVDHNGNYIVDHAGTYIVSHDSTVDVRVQVEALQQYIGKQGTLYRRNLDDKTVIHTKTARLLHAPWSQSYQDGAALANVSCVFETNQAAWRDDSFTTNSKDFATQTRPILVHNGGAMRVEDAVVQIEADGADITLVTIVNADAGISLRYAGTVADGNSAYINCETSRILNNGVDDYANFSLASDHTARCWMPMEPGDNLFWVRVVGSGNVYIRHRSQWP